MNHFESFVEEAQKASEAKGINWQFPLDQSGIAPKFGGWNLTSISGASPPPTIWLRNFGTDTKTLAFLNAARAQGGQDQVAPWQLSKAWQDFIKACVVNSLVIRRDIPQHAAHNVARPLRVLATFVGSREPWDLTREDVNIAFRTAQSLQPSKRMGDLLFGVIATIVDPNYISRYGPLLPALQRDKQRSRSRARFVKSVEELGSHLGERKHAEKLPQRRAFWELVRIVFTEAPRSLNDALMFAQTRLILLTGFRVGEGTRMPVDWKRYRDYYDRHGGPAGELGGFSRSLMVRHFAEKNRTAGQDSVALFESAQHVPPIFEEVLTSTLDKVVTLTRPLRRTLQLQVEHGRVLPDFGKDELVRAPDLYTYLTGNPFILDLPKESRESFIQQYRTDLDPRVLDELRDSQLRAIGAGANRFRSSFYMFMLRLPRGLLRAADGARYSDRRNHAPSVYFRVGEMEAYLSAQLPSKLSDSTPFKLSVGELAAWELLFLLPKRAVMEIRDGGICDVSRYYAVGRMDPRMVDWALSFGTRTLFQRYGECAEDKLLSLHPHSLRHLQNSELFRLGVADTIITTRFGRHTVAQSYVYDHRKLVEIIEPMQLPDESMVVPRDADTSTIAGLVKAGKAKGPVLEEFQRIQAAHGEVVAFEFLKAEADGFHATPYGFCINSFMVDPCPKHLECFANCRHLMATDLPEHRSNLVQIEGQFKSNIRAIEARPSRSVGRANQLAHAQERLDGVQKLLATAPGENVFPDGDDLSQPRLLKTETVLDDD